MLFRSNVIKLIDHKEKREDKIMLVEKDLCQFQVKDIVVEVKYSNNKKIDECMLNILKKKSNAS